MVPRFLFDRMLGRLCRKARMLGIDCELAGEHRSPWLLTDAERAGRTAVTTATRALDRAGPPPVVLRNAGTADMIAELLEKSGIEGRSTDGAEGSAGSGPPGAATPDIAFPDIAFPDIAFPDIAPPLIAPFTRCLECNTLLRAISPEKAAPRVPERIARDFKEFHECPGCGRVYWKGSHYEAMCDQVEWILERLERR